jgi:hypothetical protein
VHFTFVRAARQGGQVRPGGEGAPELLVRVEELSGFDVGDVYRHVQAFEHRGESLVGMAQGVLEL